MQITMKELVEKYQTIPVEMDTPWKCQPWGFGKKEIARVRISIDEGIIRVFEPDYRYFTMHHRLTEWQCKRLFAIAEKEIQTIAEKAFRELQS